MDEYGEDHGGRLGELVESIGGQVRLLQHAGRELLARDPGGEPRITAVRFEVRVDLDGQSRQGFDGYLAADGAGPGSECYTERYICGKGPSGYIWCTRDVCLEVEPVTTLPG